jgi:chemotaxis protein MotA
MDIATVIGFVATMVLLVGSIMMGASILTFWDLPSAIMVFGGCWTVTLMSFPLKKLLSVGRVSLKVLFWKAPDPVEHVLTLVRLAEVARRDGILSLENHLADGHYDDFMVRGLRMAIDGQDPAVIQASMEKELEVMLERHGVGKGIFDALGKYAPAFGMLGTIIGLVVMLKNMDDPAAIGPGMALALITTFYGSLLLNTLFGPISDKLVLRSNEELSQKVLILQGVMSIQSGDNPRIVQQKLLAFLDRKQRARVEQQKP